MLVAALEAEVEAYLERHRSERDAEGRAPVVRNGRAPPRRVTVGSGTMEIAAPRVNDRRVDAAGDRKRFTSAILPPYMRRSPKVAEVLPILYLHGLSTRDFREALEALLGEDAAGLSPANITRLLSIWEEEYRRFQTRNLGDRDYVYIWVNGVHFNVRLQEDRLCTLVMIGARPDGTKELIAVEDGFRESKDSWATLLRDLKRRGMRAPELAIGDGALGFRAALRDVWPETREQRDWVHRIGNVLNNCPSGCSQGQGRAARVLEGALSRGGTRRGRVLRRGVRCQAPEGGRDARSEPGSTARLFRLSGRALGPHPHEQSDRVGVLDRAVASAGDEGGRLASSRADDGVQAPGDGAAALATAQRLRVAAAGPCRRAVQGRHASGKRRSNSRRPARGDRCLISPIHNI
jgi:hypothetical protein